MVWQWNSAKNTSTICTKLCRKWMKKTAMHLSFKLLWPPWHKASVFGLLNCVLLWVTYSYVLTSYVSNVISLYSDWLAFSSKSVILFIRVLNYSLVSVNRYDLYIVYLTNGEKSVKLYKVLFKYLICF